MTAATTQNWLGCSINFDKVEDKTSDSSFELLLEGKRKAKIKNFNVGVIGDDNKPALIVTVELEEEKKEMVNTLYLPEAGEEKSKTETKIQNLRNFFTRCIFSNLTEEEYRNLPEETKNEALKEIQKDLQKAQKEIVNKKVLVDIRQEPFIAQDKETKAIKFTEINTQSIINKMPKQLLKLIDAQERKGTDMSKCPVILFSNRIALYGFGFYNDYDPNAVLKNSKSYDFVQENIVSSSNNNTITTATTQKAVPQF